MRVALELSCAMEPPLTGVGYAALAQAQALAALDDKPELRLFATPGPGGALPLPGLDTAFARTAVIPKARRLKNALWTRANFPPIEWFCGEVDIAHGLFHLLPAAKRAKRVVTVHDISFLRMPEVHTEFTRAAHTTMVTHAIRSADAVVCVSGHCRDELIGLLGANPARLFVVHQGIDTAEFDTELDTERLETLKRELGLHGDYFIHIGTIEPRKNLPRLLRAFGRIAHEDGAPQLLLVGKGGWLSKPSFDAIHDPALAGRVVHTGHLPRQDAIALLRGATACVYPSLYEGFGLPPLEAMAARVPVITSDAASIPEATAGHAILVDPTSEDAIEKALRDHLHNPGAAQARIKPARTHAETLTWRRSAEGLMGVYRGVVGE